MRIPGARSSKMGSDDHFRPTHSISKTRATSFSQNPNPGLWAKGNVVLRRALDIVHIPEPLAKIGVNTLALPERSYN